MESSINRISFAPAGDLRVEFKITTSSALKRRSMSQPERAVNSVTISDFDPNWPNVKASPALFSIFSLGKFVRLYYTSTSLRFRSTFHFTYYAPLVSYWCVDRPLGVYCQPCLSTPVSNTFSSFYTLLNTFFASQKVSKVCDKVRVPTP